MKPWRMEWRDWSWGCQSQMRTVTEALLTTTWETATELNVNHPATILYLRQPGRWWKVKTIILNCSLTLCNTDPFLHLTVTRKERGFYTTTIMASSKVGCSKVMPKAKLAPEGYGHSAIHYSFLNPGKIPYSRDVCSANQWLTNTEKCNTCKPELANTKSPVFLHSNTWLILEKLNKLGYELLPHPPCAPLTQQLPPLQARQQLLEANSLPQPAGYSPKVCQIMEWSNATFSKSLPS